MNNCTTATLTRPAKRDGLTSSSSTNHRPAPDEYSNICIKSWKVVPGSTPWWRTIFSKTPLYWPLLLKFLLFGNVLGIILPKIWDGDIYRIIYKVEYTIFRTCFTQKNFSGWNDFESLLSRTTFLGRRMFLAKSYSAPSTFLWPLIKGIKG